MTMPQTLTAATNSRAASGSEGERFSVTPSASQWPPPVLLPHAVDVESDWSALPQTR
jgi:hypothetical protein